jgi:hypothetical protein
LVGDAERPVPGDPPQLDQGIGLLEELLRIERERLNVAVEIEKARKIVFPETSMIVRDILRIREAIERKSTGAGDMFSLPDLDIGYE